MEKQLKAEWADSVFTGATGDETLQRNAAAIGQVNLLSKLREVTLEEIENTIYDNK